MIEVKEGDEVRVFQRYDKSQPPGGRPGRVTSVRRALFDVEWGSHNQHVATFRLDTGNKNEKESWTHVKTVAQAERDVRYADAMTRIRERHIDIRFGAKLNLEQLEELAELLDKWAAEREAK
ncbi:beta barrel domain-containing protein [Nonomuraea sp. SYSU D8015]|uniref:beta barrel domain-containing protein n=1 Tax=Nonomuraea sp. SYSU D8015 TaxID=2593644 RepID=UPI001660BD22|nr:hypothetical protein [Nonomuraea sp. SYSU D8015]